MATAQINARIDAESKARGDAGLAAAGLSPSQAIRALWELASRNENTPATITAALFPEQQQQRKTDAQAKREARARLIAQGPSIAKDSYAALGIRGVPSTASLSYTELKEQAALEHYGNAMGWTRNE